MSIVSVVWIRLDAWSCPSMSGSARRWRWLLIITAKSSVIRSSSRWLAAHAQ